MNKPSTSSDCTLLFWNRTFTILLFIAFSFFGTNGYAQGWQQVFLEGKDITGRDIIQEADGGFIIPGLHKDDEGDFHILLIKTDVDGDVVWTKKLVHSEGRTVPYGMTVCSNGDYLIGGGFNHPDFPTVTNGIKPYLVRTDNAGNIIWQKWYGGEVLNGQTEYYDDIYETPEGDFMVFGSYYFHLTNVSTSFHTIVTKIDANGNELWTNIYESIQGAKKTILTNDGNYVLVGATGGGESQVILTKINPDGLELWSKTYLTTTLSYGRAVTEAPDGSLLITGLTNAGDPELFELTYDAFLLKTNASGDSLWTNTFDFNGQEDQPADIAVMADGGYVITGHTDSLGLNNETFLIKTNPLGQEEWSRLYGVGSVSNIGYDLTTTNDGGIAITGSYQYDYVNNYLYIIKTDHLGNIYARFIEGNIAGDLNDDCSIDSNEPRLDNWLVEASNSENNFYTTTDANGNYFMEVPGGSYNLNVTPPTPYWESCISATQIDISTPYDTVHVDFPMTLAVECTYLTVDIGTPFIRWCSDSYYTIAYCNEGTIPAENVQIEIQLDTFLTLIGSSVPIWTQNGNTFVFEVGDLDISECSEIQLNVELGCDTEIQGFTHCTEAHIFPDTLCDPFNMLWDGSSIEVEGFCEGDSLRFLIHNIGDDMQGANTFFVIEDHIMLLQGDFILENGKDTSIVLYANGATYRMEAEQSAGHPGNDMPTSVVEACGEAPFNLGFVNNFAQNDNDNFIDIDCNENIFAFDPNDKRGLPEGYGEEHHILPGTDIDYRIRFQNTGTDTAFHVVIRDTLSPYLDIHSIRIGAASHDFDFDVVGNGILKFTFHNIMLPDSNVNELASHGFVKFKVLPISDVPLGTEINNRAGIYFDANLPIMTNTTWHTIQENFIEIQVVPTEEPDIPLTNLAVYPNPFTNYVIFDFKEELFNEGIFKLYRSDGQLLKQTQFRESTFRLNAQELNTGIYLYEIILDQDQRFQGKLIAAPSK